MSAKTPKQQLREDTLAHLKKAYFNARTDVVGESNGLLPKGSPHALSVLNNMTDDLMSLIDKYVAQIIGPDLPTFRYIDSLIDDKKRKACNKLLAKQRKVAGL